ncbi:MAG: DDE-type integrase/transposase/recombinase [Parvibaculaceae bacterium]|nr:DDE-type integrase/transposase/recombinase [Parvibaculaceae bacterium]
MKEWFTAQELAALKLDAICSDRADIFRQAEREGWRARPREGRGGGREYHITSLPEAARIDLALRSLSETSVPNSSPSPMAVSSSSLPEETAPHSNAGPAGMSPNGSSSILATARPATVSIPQAVDPVAGHASSRALASPQPAAHGAALADDPALCTRARATAARAVSIPTGKAARRAAARLVVINLLATFKEEGGLSMVLARQAFSSLFNRGAIPVEAWVQEEVGKVSVGSLQRWQAQVMREGAKRLGGKYGNRKGKGQIEGDPMLRDFCIANMAARPHLIATQLVQAISARFGKDIPKRTVQRFMAQAREVHANAFLQAQNPDQHKNLRLVAFGSQSAAATALNAVWEIDASPADLELLDPTTESGKRRHTLVAVVDVYSRKANVLVTPTPKATAATLVIRRAIKQFGVPDIIKMDNGKDFASAHVARALGALGIEQRFCPPFTPEGKPHVERFFQTLQHELVSMLPGFVGHNVEQRKGIEASRAFSQRLGEADKVISAEITAEELQARIDNWLAHEYHRRRHNALKASPLLQAAGWLGEVRMIEDDRALDMLLAEAPDTTGGRTVQKKGIRVENTHFIAPELGAFVGERVHVRLDPEDMGRIVVYTPDMKFICVAEAPERTGIDRREVASRAKQIQRDDLRELRDEMKRRKRDQRVHNIADEIAEDQRRKAEAETVIAFARPSTPHVTPALEAAAEAARAIDDPMPAMPALSDDDEALAAAARDALVIDMPARDTAEDQARFTDDWTWFQWARRNPDQLNDIQRETFRALEDDPVIRLHLETETSARA